jgi:hypothetical protein
MATEGPGLFENLLRGGTEAVGVLDQIDRVQQLGEDARTGMEQLGAEAQAGTAFKPFGVTAGTIGEATVGADGSIGLGLTPEQEMMATARFRQGNQLFNRAAGGIDELAAQRFGSLQDAMAPQRERERLALESRLAAQGRLGVGGAAFGGGNPEMFGLAQANREADLNAYNQAFNFAQSQQAQNANLGGLFQQAGFLPTQTMANLLTPGIQAADLAQTGQIAGQNLASQAGVTGLEAQINAESLANELVGGLWNQGAALAGNIGGMADDAGLDDFIVGKIKEWF